MSLFHFISYCFILNFYITNSFAGDCSLWCFGKLHCCPNGACCVSCESCVSNTSEQIRGVVTFSGTRTAASAADQKTTILVEEFAPRTEQKIVNTKRRRTAKPATKTTATIRGMTSAEKIPAASPSPQKSYSSNSHIWMHFDETAM